MSAWLSWRARSGRKLKKMIEFAVFDADAHTLVEDRRRSDEFVGDARGVLRPDVGDRVGGGAITGSRNDFVRSLRAVPAPVPVHRKVPAGNRRDCADPDAAQLLDEAVHETRGAARRLVAAIEKHVEPQGIEAAAAGELGDRDRVVEVAVDPAGRDQAEAVECAAAVARTVDGRAHRRVLIEAAVRDRPVDAGERLIDEPPRADGEVSDFRVALLAGRQSHRLTAGIDRRVRAPALERVELGGACRGNGVAVRIQAVSPAVEDDEHEGAHPAHAAQLGEVTSAGGCLGSGDDDAEFLGTQAHPTHQRTVDIRFAEQ